MSVSSRSTTITSFKDATAHDNLKMDKNKNPPPPGKKQKEKRLTKKQKKALRLINEETEEARALRERNELFAEALLCPLPDDPPEYVRDPNDDIPGPSSKPPEYQPLSFGGLGSVNTNATADFGNMLTRKDSEEEDVDSDGPPDEEAEAVEMALFINSLSRIRLEQGDVDPVQQQKAADSFRLNYLESQRCLSIPLVTIRILAYDEKLPEPDSSPYMTMEEYSLENGYDDKLINDLVSRLKESLKTRRPLDEDPSPDSHPQLKICLPSFIRCLQMLDHIPEWYANAKPSLPHQRNELVRMGRCLVVLRRFAPGTPPRMFFYDKRDIRYDPPIMEDFANRFYDEVVTKTKHQYQDQYPPTFNYAMVAYNEDPFWTEREHHASGAGLPRVLPKDFFRRPLFEDVEVPEEDFNYVPPPAGPQFQNIFLYSVKTSIRNFQNPLTFLHLQLVHSFKTSSSTPSKLRFGIFKTLYIF
ncbi:unnamed protein product [Caenorhabditis sp. 36 PRJEB53466]|nr:unnamed protein product [Caenorhabditis sp. 36 PRJEB53466]